MVKANIKVCLRTKPTQMFAKESILIDSNQHNNIIQIKTSTKQINKQSEGSLPQLNNKQNIFNFLFDDVFHGATQAEIYDRRARATVKGVVEGINGAILTYGQTGSGKTFTMVR